MTLSLRGSGVLFLASCLLVGCGSGPLNMGETNDAEESGESETGDPSGDGDGDLTGDGDGDPTGDGDGDATGDGDGDPAGDGDGDGDGDATGDGDGDPMLPGECIVDGALVRTLAIIDSANQNVHIHGGDDALDTISPSLPPGIEDNVGFSVTANPTHVAVASNYSFIDPGQGHGSLVQFYDRSSGELAWEHSFEFRLGVLHIDASGRLTGTSGWNGNGPPVPEGVILIDGDVTLLDDLAPRGPIRDDGWLPVQIYGGGGLLGMGFYNLDNEELEQVIEGSNAWVDREAGSIEYIDNEVSPPQFVRAQPGQSMTIELPELANAESLVDLEAVAGNYRVVVAYDMQEPTRVRIDLAGASKLVLAPDLPPGLEPFDCYGSEVSIDALGHVLYELRDPSSAQVWAWDPEIDSWEKLGLTMSGVDDIWARSVSEQVIEIQARGTGMTFCPLADWPEPEPESLLSTSLQLTRVEPALSVELEVEQWGASASVDGSQSCAMWTSPEGLAIIDLGDFEQQALDFTGFAQWLD